LGLLTCKNRLPYNLYCVGGDVKHCSLTHSLTHSRLILADIRVTIVLKFWWWNGRLWGFIVPSSWNPLCVSHTASFLWSFP